MPCKQARNQGPRFAHVSNQRAVCGPLAGGWEGGGGDGGREGWEMDTFVGIEACFTLLESYVFELRRFVGWSGAAEPGCRCSLGTRGSSAGGCGTSRHLSTHTVDSVRLELRA